MMERLVESWSRSTGTEASPEVYARLNIPTKLTESVTKSISSNQVLAEKAIKFAENFDDEESKSFLYEMAKALKESNEPQKTSFKIWKLPVARYDVKNLNGRIYPKKLWENVRDNQRDNWCLLAGLSDHPNDDGLFRDQAVIWHDMEIGDDGVVYGYGSFVGDYGHLAQEMLEHGARIGTSSSGMGEVDKYTNIVDPNTYVIDRLADLVLHPSQQTYGDSGSPYAVTASSNPVSEKPYNYDKKPAAVAVNESVQNHVNDFEVNTSSQPTSAVIRGKNMDAENKTTMTESARPVISEAAKKAEEKAYRKIIKSFLEEANKMNSSKARLDECDEILALFDSGYCQDLREEVEAKIKAEKAILEEKIESVENTERAYGMSIQEFTARAENSAIAQAELQENVKDLNSVVDSLAANNKSLQESVDKLQKENSSLRETRRQEARYNDEELAEAKRSTASVSKHNRELKESMSSLLQEKKEAEDLKNKVVGVSRTYESKLREAQKIIQNGIHVRNRLSATNRNLQEQISNLKKQLADVTADYNQLHEAYEGQEARFDELKESFEKYQAQIKDRYDESAHMAPNPNDAIKAAINLRENKGLDTEIYWNRLVKSYGAQKMAPYEDLIRGATTLREAKDNFWSVKNKLDENFAIGENVTEAVPVRGVADHQQYLNLTESFDPIASYKGMTREQADSNFAELLKKMGRE